MYILVIFTWGSSEWEQTERLAKYHWWTMKWATPCDYGEILQERANYERFSSNRHSFVLFSRHTLRGFQHVHAIHDCTWRKSYCSCSIVRGQEVVSNRRKVVSKSTVSKEDISRILHYHSQTGREVLNVAIDGIVWWYTSSIQRDTIGADDVVGSLATGNVQRKAQSSPESLYSEDCLCAQESDTGSDVRTSRSPKEIFCSKVTEFMLNNVCIPVSNWFLS